MLGSYDPATFTCTKFYCYGTGTVDTALRQLQELAIAALREVNGAPGGTFKANGKIDAATAAGFRTLAAVHPTLVKLVGEGTPARVTQFAPELIAALNQILGISGARGGMLLTKTDPGPMSIMTVANSPQLPDSPVRVPVVSLPVTPPANPTAPAPDLPYIPVEATSTGVPLPEMPGTTVAPVQTAIGPVVPAMVSLSTMTTGAKLGIGLAVATVAASVLGLFAVKRYRRARVA